MSDNTGASPRKHNDKENIPSVPLTEHDKVVLARARNTAAARKCRVKKLQERDGLKATISQLEEEVRVWKTKAEASDNRTRDIMARATNSRRAVSGYRSVIARTGSGNSLEILESPHSSAEDSLSPESKSTCTQNRLYQPFDNGGQGNFAPPPPPANRSHPHSKPSLPTCATQQHAVLSYPTPNRDFPVATRNVPTTISAGTLSNIIRYTGQVAKRQIKSSGGMKGAKTRNPYLREMAKLALTTSTSASANTLPYDWQRARRDAGDFPVPQTGQKETLVQSIYDNLGRRDD